MLDVLTIGAACVDVLVRGLGRFDPEREINPARQVELCVGGDALNEAVVLTRLGKRAGLLVALGEGNAADFIAGQLSHAGVDLSMCHRDQHRPSPVSVVMIRTDGQRSFVSPPPESLPRLPRELRLPKAKVVTLASLYQPPFLDLGFALSCARQAKEMGAVLCADAVCPPGAKMEQYRELWPLVDYFFPNLEEAETLTGERDPERAAEMILRFGVGTALVKTGKRGCLAKNQKGSHQSPAFLTGAVDTTGAGDCFASGFIAGLLEGEDLAGCCRLANAAASLAVRRIGATAGIESRRQLQDVLDGK